VATTVETSAPPAVRDAVPAPAARRRRAPAWLALLPFFGYAVICLGLPTYALV